MRFIGLQENLKRGLNIVGHATAKNINLPILNNILIKVEGGNIELVSTNLEIGVVHQVRGKIEKDGQFTVDAKLITEYVNLLNSGEKVKVEVKESELAVECGNYKTKIKGEEAKEFPLIPTIPKDNPYVCQADDLKRALNSVVFAVATSENRVELTGVLFSFIKNRLSLAATDSYRLAEKEIAALADESSAEHKVIVPAKTIQELLRILNNFDSGNIEGTPEIKIYLSDNQILFTIDSVSLISRLVNGHYPDYKQIIPAQSQMEAIIERTELLRAVKAAALFSKTGLNDVTLNFNKNKVIVSASSGASGESQIEVAAEVSGGDNEITINFRYLLDGLNNIDDDRVKIGLLNDKQPFLLKPEKDNNYLYIVMPIGQ
ncbi:TPA: DNA polymerase III subunit beta [Candidatus Falkowbacteria bacterium]|nr:MAG: polymerase III subunit beta protein [Candidatus Falkowbacteria bacterium GW2011_GWF2_43_32]HBA36280.1 DNA polymerase III subunit beta [Candidatus Falkowbacteria bacterium]